MKLTRNNQFKVALFSILNSKLAITIYLLSMITSVVSLAFYKNPIGWRYLLIISIFNLFSHCFILFLNFLDMLLLGYSNYKNSKFIIFDTVLSTICLFEIGINFLILFELQPSALSAFYIARNLAKLKVFFQTTNLQDYWITFRNLIQQISTFFTIILVIMTFYALVGIELYKDVDMANIVLRRNIYTHYFRAMLTTLTIISTESWVDVFLEYNKQRPGIVTILYFFSLFFGVSFIFLNFIISIVLDNVTEGAKKIQRRAALKQKLKANESFTDQLSFLNFQLFLLEIKKVLMVDKFWKFSTQRVYFTSKLNKPSKNMKAFAFIQPTTEKQIIFPLYLDPEFKVNKIIEKNMKAAAQTPAITKKYISCFSSFAHIIKRLIESKYYIALKFVILIFISILYTLERPNLEKEALIRQIVYYSDVGACIYFALDLLLNIIILSLRKDNIFYWIILHSVDAFVLVASILYIAGFEELSIARILRIFKVLMLVNNIPILKKIVTSLIASIRQILMGFLILFCVYISLNLICVRYLSGGYNSCDQTNYKNYEEELIVSNKVNLIITSARHCIDYGGDWVRYPLHFDDFFQGLKTLFVISTGEGWVDVMWKGFNNSTYQPNNETISITENFRVSGILIMVCLVIFDFFVVNIFTGVIVESFYKEQLKNSGFTILNKIQRSWVFLQFLILDMTPLDITMSSKFKIQILALKLMNSSFYKIVRSLFYLLFLIVTGLNKFPSSKSVKLYLSICYFSIMIVWTFELLIEVIAQGTSLLREKNMILLILEVLHYIISMVSMILWIVDAQEYPYFPFIVTIRILWIIRVFFNLKSFEKIMNVMKYALPSFVALLVLIFILVYIYSLIGLEMFAFVRQGDSGINRQANFFHFNIAMMTLFRISVGEGWKDILIDLERRISANYVCELSQNLPQEESKPFLPAFNSQNLWLNVGSPILVSFSFSHSTSLSPSYSSIFLWRLFQRLSMWPTRLKKCILKNQVC